MQNNVINVTSRRAAKPVAERTVEFVLSNMLIDRAGDTVNTNGWKLENYLADPVVLWGHDHDTPAIGRMTRIGMDAAGLVGAVRFATAEQHPFADTIFRLVEGGFINAGSVGFIPHRWEIRQDGGIDFLEQELLEYSIVNIPMNPSCLARAVASGINIEPLAKAADANRGSYDELRAKLLAKVSDNPELQPVPSTPSLMRLRNIAAHNAARLAIR